MLDIGEHERLLMEDNTWAKVWKVSKIRKLNKESQNIIMCIRFTPLTPGNMVLNGRTYSIPQFTLCLSVPLRHYLSKPISESILFSVRISWRRLICSLNDVALCSEECWRCWSTSARGPASSPGLTLSFRLKIALMMLLFVLLATFPHSCYYCMLLQIQGAPWRSALFQDKPFESLECGSSLRLITISGEHLCGSSWLLWVVIRQSSFSFLKWEYSILSGANAFTRLPIS